MVNTRLFTTRSEHSSKVEDKPEENLHVPVLMNEVVDVIKPKNGQVKCYKIDYKFFGSINIKHFFIF